MSLLNNIIWQATKFEHKKITRCWTIHLCFKKQSHCVSVIDLQRQQILDPGSVHPGSIAKILKRDRPGQKSLTRSDPILNLNVQAGSSSAYAKVNKISSHPVQLNFCRILQISLLFYI